MPPEIVTTSAPLSVRATGASSDPTASHVDADGQLIADSCSSVVPPPGTGTGGPGTPFVIVTTTPSTLPSASEPVPTA